jgi:general secretion pathway protein D
LEVSQQDNTVTIGGIDQPVIGQKRIETDMRMKDGEINIVGGLVDDEVDTSISGVPGIASIPLLGNLFKSTQVKKIQQELLMVMVPHIIRSPDITDQDLRAVATGNETSFRMNYAPAKTAPVPKSLNGTGGVPTVPPSDCSRERSSVASCAFGKRDRIYSGRVCIGIVHSGAS